MSRSRAIPVYTHDATGVTQWSAPPAPTEVSAHYDAITKASVTGGRMGRMLDKAVAVRLWHNAAKAHLITRAVESVRAPGPVSILDLACGKLGDMSKWTRLRPAAFTGVDISPTCIAEATRRAGGGAWASMPSPPKIEVVDLTAVPPGWKPAKPATLVAMHFAINYLGGNMGTLEALFALAAAHSAPGAAFVITFTNWAALSASLDGEGKVVSDLHAITLEDPDSRRYLFSLGDGCVDACAEYGVTLVDLETAAVRSGWRLHEAHGSLADLAVDPLLAVAMRAKRLEGEEAAVSGLYSGVIFVR